MASNLTTHMEMGSVKQTFNTTPKTGSVNEKSGQTFNKGTPIQLNLGVVQAWDGVTIADGIAGIALIYGSNYATDGAGAPANAFGNIGFPGTSVTYGKVPFETSAVNIPLGAPFVTGQTLFEEANQDTIFVGQFDNSNFAVAADATPVQSDIGKEYGMTIDANGYWYIDKAKTGGTAVCVIVELDPIQGSVLNAPVFFRFLRTVQQFNQ